MSVAKHKEQEIHTAGDDRAEAGQHPVNEGAERATQQTPMITPKEERNPAEEVDFSPQVRELIEHRENMGYFENPDARGIFQGCCGDSMQIDLRLEGDTILEARFLVDGCGATIACGSMLTRMIRMKTLDEANQIAPEDLLDALGGLPGYHRHCAHLSVRTLREVVKNVRGNRG